MTTAWLPRAGRSLLVLIVIAALTCQLALLLPGDPALILLGQESTEAQREALRHTLGLDQNGLLRFLSFMGGVVTGDWGTSFTSGRPVLSEILARVPATAELVILSQVVALAIAIPLALHSARNPGGRFDRITSTGTFLLLALPSFVVGVLAIQLFAVQLGWLPASGYTPFAENPLDNLSRMVLPVFTLGVAEGAVYLRALRGSAMESLHSPYAYASIVRGASDPQLLWWRILRPSSSTLIALVGINLAVALGGTLLVESLFAIPGLGRLTVGALGARDLPVIQGVVLFAAVIVVVAGILTDIAVRRVDPRSTRERH
ncbi:peptide/nickel transport system permease protein [Glaciihabitans tibetensis]|uniref:Peptide/nickel transport system permease protein n=1 Tax=Glaciihabitans tibetensis TaxID=1266600 RepID=A0A2T0V298_9MICO|nr:ABC transporter permease [Glaciihabitans tibetensis]PRY64309.1 peptide/nickel transport system permease protein [Glaciihabitans tibetensis]